MSDFLGNACAKETIPSEIIEHLFKIADFLQSEAREEQPCFDEPPQPVTEHDQNLLITAFELREIASKLKSLS